MSPRDRIPSMMNTIDKRIDHDGTLFIDEVLGSYHRLGYEPFLDKKGIKDLNDRATYLEDYGTSNQESLTKDDSLVEISTSGLLDVTTGSISELQRQYRDLIDYADSELRRLSKVINDYDFIIPDQYKIVLTPIEVEDEVFYDDEKRSLGFTLMLIVGKAKIRFSGDLSSVKSRLHDMINGAIIFASSCIRMSE